MMTETQDQLSLFEPDDRPYLPIYPPFSHRPLIDSALNYMGGKRRVLTQMLPYFPERGSLFVDLFCGGGSVGINVPFSRVWLNDKSSELIGLFRFFRHEKKERVFAGIERTIDQYGLSRCREHGYAYYGCSALEGLAKVNRAGFLALREAYNRSQQRDPLLLYVLVIYAFNNQLRFNSRGEYNLPVGKRDFNDSMRRKLSLFIDRLQEGDFLITCGDFRGFDPRWFGRGGFVYCDPPYRIATASYNERDGWGAKDEGDLLSLLDRIDRQGSRFALSGLLRGRGREDALLLGWLKENQGRYHALPVQSNFTNTSYHLLDRKAESEEVLIVNGPLRVEQMRLGMS